MISRSWAVGVAFVVASAVAGCGTTRTSVPQVACARHDPLETSKTEHPATSTSLDSLDDAAVDAIRIGRDVLVVTTVAAVMLGGDPAPAPRCAHLVAIDRTTGYVRWSRARPAECGDELVSVEDDGVWYVDGTGRMLFLSTADGLEKSPSVPRPGSTTRTTSPNGRVTSADGRTRFDVTPYRLVAVDASSNEVRFATRLPESFPPKRAGDRVVTSEDGSIVAVAAGDHFAGFRAETGELLWSLDAPGVAALLPDERRTELQRALGAVPVTENETPETIEDGALVRLKQVDAALTPAGEPVVATAFSSESGLGLPLASADPAPYAGEQRQEVVRLLESAAAADRAEERLRIAVVADAGLRSGDFLVRRFRGDGSKGVIVIRIADGAFVRIATGPSQEGFDDWVLDSTASLSADGSLLVVAASSVEGARWAVDGMQRCVPVTVPTVQTFELDDFVFQLAASTTTASIVAKD